MASFSTSSSPQSGIVFASTPPLRSSCCFPSVCVTRDREWLCTCRSSPKKAATAPQSMWLTRSRDGGATWSAPVEPWTPRPIDGRAGAFRFAALSVAPDGVVHAALAWMDVSRPERPMFNEATEGLLEFRVFTSESRDNGGTWSAPRAVDTSPFNQPVPLTGPMLHLRDGGRAIQLELNKHYEDTRPWRHLPVLMFSRDGGCTWPRFAHPAADESNRVFYWDQRSAVLCDGRILSVFWTYDTREARYLNIHQSESSDGGHTWSAPRDIGVPGQPAWPVELDDRRLALAYVDRSAEPMIKLRVSPDAGKTWPASSERVVYRASQSQEQAKRTMQDTWAEMTAFSVGLPAAARVDARHVLVSFYAGPDADHTDIRWAVVEV